MTARAESLRKKNAAGLSRASGRDPRDSEDRLRDEIQLLEKKIARLREQRRQSYDAGRRAGFLPGELEGRAAVP